MSTLVCNQSTCSDCANPSGQCFCHIREQVRNALTANFGEAGNHSVAAAYKSLLVGDDGDTKAGRYALGALEATRDGDSEKARELHLRAAEAHDDAADQAEEDNEGKVARKNRSCAALHRRAAAVHAVQSSVEQDGQEDAVMNTGQPRDERGRWAGVTPLMGQEDFTTAEDEVPAHAAVGKKVSFQPPHSEKPVTGEVTHHFPGGHVEVKAPDPRDGGDQFYRVHHSEVSPVSNSSEGQPRDDHGRWAVTPLMGQEDFTTREDPIPEHAAVGKTVSFQPHPMVSKKPLTGEVTGHSEGGNVEVKTADPTGGDRYFRIHHSEVSPVSNAGQPRHPRSGQYQGLTHKAAQRGASPDLEDGDGDGLCPSCGSQDVSLRWGKDGQPACGDCGWKQPTLNDEDEDDEEDGGDGEEVENRKRKEDEDEDEEDDEDEDEQTTNARNRSSNVDDILYPPQTLRSILAANAAGKAEGSNADLIGTDDSDYGYSRPGRGRASNYDAEQRKHSVSEVFGYPTGAGENLFGAGMSQDDLDAENARRMQMGDLAERDLPPEQSVSPQRNPTRYASGQRVPTGVRPPLRGDSVTATRSAELVRHQRADILSPPSMDDIIVANQQEQRRRYDRRTGRMVNNSSAPTLGDLPSPEMID